MKTFFLRKLAFPFLCLTLFQAPSAYAETTECTEITALPITITSQGVFCLKRSIGLSPGLLTGAAIDIQTNNVIIDLNEFKIGNLSAGTGTEANGIQAVNRQNIVVKNGTVRGFAAAIVFSGANSSGHVIEDMLLDQNTVFGILGEGTGFVIQRNQIVLVGGSTQEEFDSAFGIALTGSNMRVLDNEIAELFADVDVADSTFHGIVIRDSSGSVVQNNRISNEQLPTPDLGIGIFIISSFGGVNVRDNHVLNFSTGIFFSDSGGIYSGNQIFNANIVFSGGTNGGNNAFGNTLIPIAQAKSSSANSYIVVEVKKLQKTIKSFVNSAP